MTPIAQIDKIQRVMGQLENSNLSDAEKDSFSDLLLNAENLATESPKSIDDVGKSLSAFMVVYVREHIRKMEAYTITGWRGILIQCKWPISVFLSVGVFSPNFPGIISFVEKFIK
jgi:hypothetical protein